LTWRLRLQILIFYQTMNLSKSPELVSNNSVNTRMCVVCRQRGNKFSLLCFTRVKEQIFFDPDFSKKGRSAYLCNNEACLKKAFFNKKNKNLIEINLKKPLVLDSATRQELRLQEIKLECK